MPRTRCTNRLPIISSPPNASRARPALGPSLLRVPPRLQGLWRRKPSREGRILGEGVGVLGCWVFGVGEEGARSWWKLYGGGRAVSAATWAAQEARFTSRAEADGDGSDRG